MGGDTKRNIVLAGIGYAVAITAFRFAWIPSGDYDAGDTGSARLLARVLAVGLAWMLVRMQTPADRVYSLQHDDEARSSMWVPGLLAALATSPIAFLLMLAVADVPVSALGDSAQERLGLAHHYQDIGQPERVLDALSDPEPELLDTGVFWLLRGCALHSLDRSEQAAEALGEGLAIEPENTTLLQMSAHTHARMNRFERAEELVLEALRLDPEDPDLYVSYADICVRAGQAEKAERLIQEALRIDPEIETETTTQWLIELVRGRERDRDALSSAIVGANPDDDVALLLKGSDLCEQGKIVEGFRLMREAATQDPADRRGDRGLLPGDARVGAPGPRAGARAESGRCLAGLVHCDRDRRGPAADGPARTRARDSRSLRRPRDLLVGGDPRRSQGADRKLQSARLGDEERPWTRSTRCGRHSTRAPTTTACG